MLIQCPYFKQTKDHTCGPASVRMILAFWGIHVSEDEISKALTVDKYGHTKNHDFKKVFAQYGLTSFEKSHARLKDIKHFLKKGLPVLVNYIEPKDGEGHIAVVVGHTPGTITLHDPSPDLGKGFTISSYAFSARWHGKFDREKRFMIVAQT